MGVLLRGIDQSQIKPGMVLSQPNSITAHTEFEAAAYFLTKQEGGRQNAFFSGYRPQFFIYSSKITDGIITLPKEIEMVIPGDTVDIMRIKLNEKVALEQGSNFAILEGKQTVGAGIVTKIIR